MLYRTGVQDLGMRVVRCWAFNTAMPSGMDPDTKMPIYKESQFEVRRHVPLVVGPRRLGLGNRVRARLATLTSATSALHCYGNTTP